MGERVVIAAMAAAFALTMGVVPAAATVGPTDLQVGVRAVADRVQIGDYAYFDTGAVNNGPGDATGVVITDQLPSGLVFAPALSDPACSSSGQTVTCPVGVMWNHSVTDLFRIAAQTTALGTFTVTASVSADQSDPIPSNNSA